jgi:hypothetical protein
MRARVGGMRHIILGKVRGFGIERAPLHYEDMTQSAAARMVV